MVSKEQEKKIIDEIILLVDIFLKTNASDIELEKKTGISSSTVGRRLTDYDRFLKAFPNGEEVFNKVSELRKQNLYDGKIKGAQISNILTIMENNKIIMLRLEVLANTEEKQWQLLKHIILTFRAKLPLLSELFQIPENVLYENLLRYNPNSFDALKYLFENDYASLDQNKEQENAKEKILQFYRDLLRAKRKGDINEIRRLNYLISDYDTKRVMDKIRGQQETSLTDDDIGIILNWQLKYAQSIREVGQIFGISQRNYSSRLKKYLEGKDELQRRYEHLEDYQIHYRNNILRSGYRHG